MDPGEASHPCLRCGACCAYYRVSFYWREADSENNPLAVPAELTEAYSDFRVAMKGTNRKHHSRCAALEGKVGELATCSIYSLRPSPCREFAASFERGVHEPRCDDARSKYGLPPLKARDFEAWRAFERLSATKSTCYTAGHEQNEEPGSPASP